MGTLRGDEEVEDVSAKGCSIYTTPKLGKVSWKDVFKCGLVKLE